MLLLKQLELAFEYCSRPALPGRHVCTPQDDRSLPALPGRAQHGDPAAAGPWLKQSGRDFQLEANARVILSSLGAVRLAAVVRVEWNPRLRSCAGRADFQEKLVSLNPRLSKYGGAEIDRTLRHELAHLLAQFRAGRRRILPHGREWRDACHDLAIGDERRCHNLPLPTRERTRRFLYKCPSCQRDFPRVRRIKRAIACLACCRAHNGGEFDARFRLRLLTVS
jgi:SprT protein